MIDRRHMLAAAAGLVGIHGADDGTARGRRGGRRRHRGNGPSQGGAGRPKGGRPNLVLVILDDMRTSDWQALPKTRSRLSAGSWFPNYFNGCPLCSPARVSLMTGLHVHNHRVMDNGGNSDEGGHDEFHQQDLESKTLNAALRGAGYHTGMIGKYLNGFKALDWRPMGWNRWVASTSLDYTDFVLDIDGERVEFRGAAYKTDVLRDHAVRFIMDAPENQPIYLQFCPTAPHGPSVPAARHRSSFPDAEVKREPCFNEADVSDKPSPLQDMPLLGPAEIAAMDRVEGDRLRTLLAADEAIVAVVDALQRVNRLEDTSIIVASDNGYLLGHHRLLEMKGTPYDQAIRTPMLAWGAPFKTPRDRRLACNVDIAPTFAALAGITMPRSDGFDLLGGHARDYALLTMPGNMQAPVGTGLRSEELMYVEYVTGEREFYDRRVDMGELVNLLPPGSSFDAASPVGLPAISDLSARARALGRCAGVGCW